MKIFSRQKIFCIGANKTGTTSLEVALKNMGYRMGSQAKAELLIHDWAKRDFRKIIKLCRSADVFQDIPFSAEYVYQALDQAYPGSKFILTIRDNKEQWYDSLVRFHTKLIGKNRTPTPDDLKTYNYRYKGWLWDVMQLKYGVDETTLYDKNIYTNVYERHNNCIIDYFRYRKNDLLVLNLSDKIAMEKLYGFLGHKFDNQKMPHANKT